MAEITDRKLLNLITYAPATIVGAFTLLWAVLAITDVLLSSEEKLEAFQEDYYQRENTILTKQVEYVAQQVKYARERTEHQLETTIKERIYEAHNIATRLYESNQHLPEAQVTKLITDALRDIRFNNGRGYFFIYKTEGLNVMHPLLPRVEGTSLWDFKDVRGSYIVREMGEQVKRNGEAFYRWWFVKPDNKNKEFEKIGFGKYFEPYDWFIGTGDYVVDVENDIKQTVLAWIKNLRFGEFGYVFVLDNDGQILSHIDESLIGQNALSLGDQKHIEGVKQILNTNQDFITYPAIFTPPGVTIETKTSYVYKEPSWGWSIGAGTYDQTSQQFLMERQEQVELEQKQALSQMIIIGSITTIIVALFSLIMSRMIARRFQLFQSKINNDFNQLQQTKDKLEHMALHDELTGLPNRSLLHEHIAQGVKTSSDNCQQLAVMFVDLDDFKKVNDLYGHSAGDRLLSEIGKKFEAFLEPHEFVARFGGDEFIFCFPCLNNLAETESKVDQIKNVFKQHFVIDNKVLFASCSIGVSMFPTDGHEPEDLISKADIVLYKSKARQKGDVLFFDSKINQQVQYDFLLERELRGAVERGELSVVYQPQIDAKNGKLYGVESLLRWHNPQLGHVSPLEFISLAEEIGLINQLGEFVLERSCEEISQHFPDSDLMLSINISPMQLTNEMFVPQLLAAIARHNLTSKRITLEITENVLINDLPKVTPIITQLKELGFTISLDDFGTGYSSLSYLSNLSLDELKIDRVFIDKMLTSEQSDSLVKAIMAIAQSANMRVVAEGVETLAQKEVLINYGCDILQGYLIEKPIAAELLVEKYGSM
ncbi:GGDEF domain-containing protein [Vibrio sinaloensis DSM 21326]|uniref:GGDEF domain-containing protein n=1 Tax=Vibrio sinaloensis DSM 21326 TaxID=945550 RepID=E8MAU3_PHOS4|nr:cache domain-containing protein [Vibrio sinaloensis]EGA68773.1 GGDEF domain-containing protein [Vibrio sinaloensis DSM 21326]